MASFFPELSPSVRVYTTGGFASTARFGADGSYTGFRRGSRQVGQTLQLRFSHLSQANMNVIKAHYLERKGTFDFFFASASLWGDYSDAPPVPLLGNTAWRFASPPEVTDVSFDRFDVSVELVSHAILQGDFSNDASASTDAAAAAADYIYDAGDSTTVARDYLLNPGAS
mgnify:CR=1 FL=1